MHQLSFDQRRGGGSGVNYKGKKMKVEGVVTADRNLDIAVLRVKGKVQALTLGDSDKLEEGARVFALGANESGDITISEGTMRKLTGWATDCRR